MSEGRSGEAPPPGAAPPETGGDPPSLSEGFAVGHWSDPVGRTGCTVVIPPPATRAAADVRGGGPGTRELDVLESLATPEEVSAVVLAGGSAFGLAAADGVSRWLEESGRGYETLAGRVPLVPAAVVYDLADGDPRARPDAAAGYSACEAAGEGVPERGRVGAGTGVAVGKILGRDRATPSGVGYCAMRIGSGETVAAIVIANAFGDVIDSDGSVLGGARRDGGPAPRAADEIVAMAEPPQWASRSREATTLACVCTDATLTKPGCGAVARMASAGIARAVDPVFSPVDGDVAFCLASGRGQMRPWAVMAVGTAAATVTAAAIRDAVRQAAPSA